MLERLMRLSQGFLVFKERRVARYRMAAKRKTWLQILAFPLIRTENWRGVEPWGAVRGHFSEEVILV